MMTSTSTSPPSSTPPTSFLECPICRKSLLLEHLQQGQPASSEEAAANVAATDMPDDWSPICTPCGHMFHRACITEWFRVRQSYEGEASSQNRCYCPSCRKAIAYHKLVRVYLPITPAYDDDRDNMSVSLRPAVPNISVSEAVRRYNEQHYNMTMNRGYDSNNGYRIYNDLFALSSRRFSQNLDQNQVVRVGDTDTTYALQCPFQHGQLRNRQQGGQNQGYQYNNGGSDDNPAAAAATTNLLPCENADCIALKSVLDLLSRELTWTQRKLEVEVDISRMKSILVRGLQKDIDMLRKMRRGAHQPKASRIIWILLISFFLFWLTACFCAVAF